MVEKTTTAILFSFTPASKHSLHSMRKCIYQFNVFLLPLLILLFLIYLTSANCVVKNKRADAIAISTRFALAQIDFNYPTPVRPAAESRALMLYGYTFPPRGDIFFGSHFSSLSTEYELSLFAQYVEKAPTDSFYFLLQTQRTRDMDCVPSRCYISFDDSILLWNDTNYKLFRTDASKIVTVALSKSVTIILNSTGFAIFN